MKGNYIVFDCETGGLDCMLNPITQIALMGVDAKSGKELGRYETYIKPYDDLVIDPLAISKSMVDVNDLARGANFKDVVRNIAELCKQVAGGKLTQFSKPIMVGHNVSFDISFLEVLFYLADKKIESCFAYNNTTPYYVDTQQSARNVWPTAASIKLGDCCERAGITLVDAHGAMNDVIATKNLFLWFKSLMSQGSGNNTNAGEIKTEKSDHRKFFKI